TLFVAEIGPFLGHSRSFEPRQFVSFVKIWPGQVAVETSKLNANDALFFGCCFLRSLKRQ
ncbi:MAG: hypothetical protein MUF34_29800, partial [Polyangiaceae bacterium]|nr:hypothetical protein [Polyangiaceae bacterium]